MECWTRYITVIIIHQTHYEKSDWSRAFNQFTIGCELDMINAISAADIALSCQVQRVLLRNKMAERFASVSEYELCEKCINKLYELYEKCNSHDIMLNLIQSLFINYSSCSSKILRELFGR